MPKFRKKPVVIEAMQWTGSNIEELRVFGGLAIQKSGGELFIKTLEGKLGARRGDWIIKGVADEVYPCRPDIFSSTYEPVSDDQT